MEKIGMQQALSLLAQAVATQGDAFVYQDKSNWADTIGCINVPYTDDIAERCGLAREGGAPAVGSPKRSTGCVVGTALALGGVPVHEHPTGPVWTFRDYLTENAMDMLRVAQLAQDNGVPWGVARDVANAFADALWRRLSAAGLPLD